MAFQAMAGGRGTLLSANWVFRNARLYTMIMSPQEALIKSIVGQFVDWRPPTRMAVPAKAASELRLPSPKAWRVSRHSTVSFDSRNQNLGEIIFGCEA